MRILLKLELDCEPDAAWRAVRSPAVMQKVAYPFLSFTSLEEGGFDQEWSEGDHLVFVKALGFADFGTQVISISYPRRRDGVRIMRDDGPALTGPVSLLTRWQHQLAVASTPAGKTLYREELRFSAGIATPLLWTLLWPFWQWRAFGLRRIATSWR
jgi:hypothetical protein